MLEGGFGSNCPIPPPHPPQHPPSQESPPPPSLPISERVHRSENLFRLLPSLGQITSLIEANFLRIEEPLAKRIFRLDRFFCSGKYNCKSLPFFYCLTFEKGRLLYNHPVGWLVGRSVGRLTSPLIFSIYRGITALY